MPNVNPILAINPIVTFVGWLLVAIVVAYFKMEITDYYNPPQILWLNLFAKSEEVGAVALSNAG